MLQGNRLPTAAPFSLGHPQPTFTAQPPVSHHAWATCSCLMEQMWPGSDNSCSDRCITECPGLVFLGPWLQLQRARCSLSPFSSCGWSGELGAAKPWPKTPHFSMWRVAQLQVFPVEAHMSCCSRFQASKAFAEPFSSLAVPH